MNPCEKLYVFRWWSKSAVKRMEDVTLNPSEFLHLLHASGDAMDIERWSISELLEIKDEHDPRND